jgi:hypothetical protein
MHYGAAPIGEMYFRGSELSADPNKSWSVIPNLLLVTGQALTFATGINAALWEEGKFTNKIYFFQRKNTSELIQIMQMERWPRLILQTYSW